MAGEKDTTSAMHEVLEGLGPLREGMIGYRTQLIADGWSAEAAERIAAHLFLRLQGLIGAD